MGCPHCGPASVDPVRDALELTATVLAGGAQAQYRKAMERLLRTPESSLSAMATLLLLTARPEALDDVRHLAVVHALRELVDRR